MLKKIRKYLLQYRFGFFFLFGKEVATINNPNSILIVITHFTAQPEQELDSKVEKLTQVLQGIFISFARYSVKIIINTIKDKNILGKLKEYQNTFSIIEQNIDNPLLLGFEAQTIFKQYQEQFDYFVFLEDDIVMYDALFLEKIANFNKNSGNIHALLLPHRYELYLDKKIYIDMAALHVAYYNPYSKITIHDKEFVVFKNPHTGMYCLNKKQLKLWLHSGQVWSKQVTFFTLLESAATGCLFECFQLYKPQFNHMDYLEVRHFDTKYALKFYNRRYQFSALDIKMNRIEVIQYIIDKLKAKTYLEIGVETGCAFFQIRAPHKIAVDPQFKMLLKSEIKWIVKNPSNLFAKYHEITSDAFFAKFPAQKRLDVVFVDGLHTHQQVLKDIENSLKHLNKNGVIVVHDCFPPHAAAAIPAHSYKQAQDLNPEGWTGEWCGDVWKAICYLRAFREDLSVFVLDTDYGLGIITRKPAENTINLTKDAIDQMSYQELFDNKETYLNLKPVSYLQDFFNAY